MKRSLLLVSSVVVLSLFVAYDRVSDETCLSRSRCIRLFDEVLFCCRSRGDVPPPP